MSDAPNAELQQAFELIEAEQLDEARDLLSAYLAENEDDADAWWLYAHAVTDVEDARNALDRVTQLNPTYPGAKALIAEVENTAQPQPETSSGIKSLGGRAAATETDEDLNFDDLLDEESAFDDDEDFDLDEEFDFDDEFGDELAEEEGGSRRRFLMAVVAILAVVLILFVVFVLDPFGLGRAPEPQATVVAAESATPLGAIASATPAPALTDEATATKEPTVAPTNTTEPVATATEATSDTVEFQPFVDSLEDFDLAEEEPVIETTSLGETLTLFVCTAPGATLRSDTPAILEAVASVSEDAASEVDALGVRMVDCSQDETQLAYVLIDIEDAVAFADGSLSAEEFRTTWQPQ